MNAQCSSFRSNRNDKSFLHDFDERVGSGILSGMLSPALSVGGRSTPGIPMTPLTTPKSPLQWLIGRDKFGTGAVRLFRPSSSVPLSSILIDGETDHHCEKQLLIEVFENFLASAETVINEITEREISGHQVLGQGIARLCRDMASEIEGLAKGFRSGHGEEEDGSAVENEGKSNSKAEVVVATNRSVVAPSSLAIDESTISLQSQEEFISNLSTAHSLLLDTAAALRAITQQEAQELGEVALEVARMFFWSLGMAHRSIATESLDRQPFIDNKEIQKGDDKSKEKSSRNSDSKKKTRVTWSAHQNASRLELGPVAEISKDEEKKDEHYGITQRLFGSPTNITAGYTIPFSPPKELSSPNKIAPTNLGCNRHSSRDRVRVLWPPILPAITEASKHVASNAKEHPIRSMAVGMACGPALIATAAISGPPLLVADWAIQRSYDALEHHPMIENVERGAANALQVARLAVLSSKLVVKQGATVCERQIERRGGMDKVLSNAVDGVVGIVLHPLNTVGIMWEGLLWVGGATKDAVESVKEIIERGELGMDIHL